MQEIITILVITLIILLIIDFFIQTLIFQEKYSQAPLQIKTFDGSDQLYHLSVIYSANGWNGFQYWMTLTPYPMQKAPYKDRWECPCIYCSTDGISWNSQIGFQNPLDDLTDSIKIFSPIHTSYSEKIGWNVGTEYHTITIMIEILIL